MNKPLSIASGFVLVGLLFSQPALALVPGTAAESPPTSSLSTSATAAAAAAATGFIIAKKAKAKAADKKAGKADTSYFLGRETLLASGEGEMSRLAENLFAFMSRNATSATAFFNLPHERVVEIGIQLDL